MSRETIELLVAEVEGGLALAAPEVGYFSNALPLDAVVGAGAFAGTLTALGRSFDLKIPASVSGRITNERPGLVQKPVGYGEVIYVVAPLQGARPVSARVQSQAHQGATGLVLRAPQSGRFYHRPSPGDPTFVSAGSTVEDGTPVGMIEVMKTFSHVPYRATGGLPRKARVVRLVAPDGADVKAGDVLVELEPVA